MRRHAALALAPFGSNEQAGDALRRALLNDQEQEVREVAAQALSALGDVRSREVLLGALLVDRAPLVRVAALHALGSHTDDGAVRRAIAARLVKDDDPRVREEAAVALHGSRDDFCLSLLSQVLSDPAWRDDESQVRLAAACSLEHCTLPAAFDALARALSNDPVPAIRRRAAAALTRRRDESSLKALHRALLDGDPGTRASAVQALAGCEEAPVIATIAELLEHDLDWNVRRAAAESLRGGESPAASKGLLQALFDNSPHVRLAAAESLQGISDPKVLQQLLRVISSARMERYRFFAARALQRSANPEVVRSLAELCTSGKSTTIREAAAFALGRRGGLMAQQTAAQRERERVGD